MRPLLVTLLLALLPLLFASYLHATSPAPTRTYNPARCTRYCTLHGCRHATRANSPAYFQLRPLYQLTVAALMAGQGAVRDRERGVLPGSPARRACLAHLRGRAQRGYHPAAQAPSPRMNTLIQAAFWYCCDFMVNLGNLTRSSYCEANTWVLLLALPGVLVLLIGVRVAQWVRLRRGRVPPPLAPSPKRGN